MKRLKYHRRLNFRSDRDSLKGQALFLTGQAMLELSIFGSLFIMLLGILVNYGIRYNLQQQIIQQTFRKALVSAAASADPNTAISVSHMVLKDVHIPDPSNPFGVGSVTPITAQAGLTCSYQLELTPDPGEEEAYPKMQFEVMGDTSGVTRSLKTARVRPVTGWKAKGDAKPILDKYQEIYGESNVWQKDRTRLIDSLRGTTVEEYKIFLLDPMLGDYIDYDATVRLCRLIVDKDACKASCEKANDEEKDCDTICNVDIPIPKLCEGCVETDATNHIYDFSNSNLNKLFSFAINSNKPKAMGLQQDSTQQITQNNKLEKTETPANITTTDTWDWNVTTTRKIVKKDGELTTKPEAVNTTVSQNEQNKWKANW